MSEAVELRDYLAAHAPVEPQPWFVPVVIAKPSEPPLYPDEAILDALLAADQQPDLDDEDYFGWEEIGHVKETLDEWRRDAAWDIDERFEELAFWCDIWRDYWKAMQAWSEQVRKAALVQWPYAWADAMLVERGRV